MKYNMKYKVRGTRHQAPGTRREGRGAKCKVQGGRLTNVLH